MEVAGPQQAVTSPHQVDANLYQEKLKGSQNGNPRISLERREDHEGSVHITHTNKYQS